MKEVKIDTEEDEAPTIDSSIGLARGPKKAWRRVIVGPQPNTVGTWLPFSLPFIYPLFPVEASPPFFLLFYSYHEVPRSFCAGRIRFDRPGCGDPSGAAAPVRSQGKPADQVVDRIGALPNSMGNGGGEMVSEVGESAPPLPSLFPPSRLISATNPLMCDRTASTSLM